MRLIVMEYCQCLLYVTSPFMFYAIDCYSILPVYYHCIAGSKCLMFAGVLYSSHVAISSVVNSHITETFAFCIYCFFVLSVTF